jgi:hypothetical protein
VIISPLGQSIFASSFSPVFVSFELLRETWRWALHVNFVCQVIANTCNTCRVGHRRTPETVANLTCQRQDTMLNSACMQPKTRTAYVCRGKQIHLKIQSFTFLFSCRHCRHNVQSYYCRSYCYWGIVLLRAYDKPLVSGQAKEGLEARATVRQHFWLWGVKAESVRALQKGLRSSCPTAVAHMQQYLPHAHTIFISPTTKPLPDSTTSTDYDALTMTS